MNLADMSKDGGRLHLSGAIQAARDAERCGCKHPNVSHGYGDDDGPTWVDGSRIGMGPCGADGCGCGAFARVSR